MNCMKTTLRKLNYQILWANVAQSKLHTHLIRKYSTPGTPLYVQGQSPAKNIREYFYYIDHQGMLYLDDSKMKNFTSCFKDPKFLVFFFKRMRKNETNRYDEQFPYISLCGREINYIRCDDKPVVYSHVITKDGKDLFCYGNAGNLLYEIFEPAKIFMNPENGRVYHPCAEKLGSVGLIRVKLAIEFTKLFTFNKGESKPPSHFEWKGKIYDLETSMIVQNKTIIKGTN